MHTLRIKYSQSPQPMLTNTNNLFLIIFTKHTDDLKINSIICLQ